MRLDGGVQKRFNSTYHLELILSEPVPQWEVFLSELQNNNMGLP
jgi:hypothetical protein